MKKRMLSIILIFTMVIASFSFASGEEGLKSNSLEEIYLNDDEILMIPLRSTLENLDYQVNWNEEDRSVNVLKDKEEILLKIDDKNVVLEEKTIQLENQPVLKDTKTFVPAELLSKSLDLIVGWNKKHNNLDIREGRKNKEDFFNLSGEEDLSENLSDYMKALEKNQNFNGSILVAKEGKILLNEAYGFSNLKQNIINKPETRFAIGSITKQFAAMGILKLSEEGLLNLEDPVSKYIPDFPHGEKISIHNLLTHTSGLENYTNIPLFLEIDQKNKDPMKLIDLIKDMELRFQPGEKFEYSNTNYLALGIVIEKVSGNTFEKYLEEMVKPLGMDDTGMIYGEIKGSNDASPYIGYLELEEIDDDAVLSQAYAAGSMYSTVEDLYRWDRAIKSGKLLKEETKREMFKEHIPMSEGGSYGYGWMMETTDLGKEIYHGGNTQGFTSYMGSLEDQDINIIILTNVGIYNTNNLREDLLSIVLKEEYEIPKELKPIEIEDQDLYSNYVGKYDFVEGLDLNIVEKEDKLYIQLPAMESFEIYPQTTTEFFGKALDVKVEFKIDGKGKATELILNYGGMEFECKRIGEIEEKKEVEVDPKIYNDYVGEYDLTMGATITITKEEDKLYARVTGQEAFQIFPTSETEFFYKVVDANISFVRDDSGEVTSLIMKQSGQELNSPKIR